MQPNVITLTVDELNDGSITADATQTFTRFEEFQNRSTYIGEDHSLQSRKTLSMYRSFPKMNGNFLGVGKTSVKLTEDITVSGADGVSTLTAPIIIEVNYSIPVGATTAQVLRARQRALALQDRDDVMDPLNNQLMV